MGTTEQKNLYIPGQNLTNLALNVDYNRLQIDQVNIEVDFTSSPAEVTVKVGSWIEINGNLFEVTVDEVFTMNSANDNYITYHETNGWDSTTIKGSYNDSKNGVYQADNVTRTCRWYIDQVEETFNIDDSLQSYNIGDLKTEANSYKIDSVDTGILIATDTFTGIQDPINLSSEFTVYKPITFIFNQIISSTFGEGTFYFEIKYNSSWVEIYNSGNITITVTNLLNYFSLNPGLYRIRLSGRSSVSPTTIEINGYLLGVYGQANLDAVSVYS